VPLPRIDIDVFLGARDSPEALEECRKAAEGLHQFGILIVGDSRVTEVDNSKCVPLSCVCAATTAEHALIVSWIAASRLTCGTAAAASWT
jgi:hypothetical protein